ncbi:MAG: TetR/AcrR family transcriptional regulator [Cyanobacteria bacterium J06628_3]
MVVAFLEERNQLFWEYFDIAVSKHSDDGSKQLLSVLEWIDELLVKPECYGCPFLITISEFPQLDYPGHQVAINHKKELQNRLIRLAKNAGVSNAEQLGKYLLLLVDGAFSQRRLLGLNGFETNLKAAGEILINAQF